MFQSKADQKKHVREKFMDAILFSELGELEKMKAVKKIADVAKLITNSYSKDYERQYDCGCQLVHEECQSFAFELFHSTIADHQPMRMCKVCETAILDDNFEFHTQANCDTQTEAKLL